MPPKSNRAQKAQDKKTVAQKQKAVEDKTFGLKNKNKSKNVQKYVQTLTKTVEAAAKAKNIGTTAAEKKSKKLREEEAQKELDALFGIAIKQPKVPLGVDPKSLVCEFFRHGKCTKGAKCKFAHDLAVERKTQKIDLFSDKRELGGGEDETMEDWDQDQLEKVVNQKLAMEQPSNRTEIVCKFFLEAVEKRLYGWFWQCPNGKECKYRHALPPGYVLKSQMKELLDLETANRKDIEDVIEEERAKVVGRTPITSQTFNAWKKKKSGEREVMDAQAEADRRRKGQLTGREIFMQEGFVAEDDIGASDEYAREIDEEAEFLRIQEAAMAANQRAREEQGADVAGSSSGAGPSSSRDGGANGSGAGPSGIGASHVAAEDEHLFYDDDDDEEEEEEEDDDEEELLEELEAGLRIS